MDKSQKFFSIPFNFGQFMELIKNSLIVQYILVTFTSFQGYFDYLYTMF